ncbi:uncharacterized protein PHACADRAFT_191077 [Phanerochaete carnosa HHB-10118-sp]|uniref:F-box domain-containing protein n=1 Tax=Phanerochaete carnosa (strain HHB-10118-sp) TaxID=650164 RepID=K5WRL9_PHACS|nr:uncharacterized protein PHACADRAFT_191077 [Phanerochaete carnosa HHB-10118-sp]EKM61884.1 hypothetical protein PHACADRAFT_191077 [Phanerochaete carnosa HHB-10118-sp]
MSTLTTLRLELTNGPFEKPTRIDAKDMAFLTSLPRLKWLELSLDTFSDRDAIDRQLSVTPLLYLLSLELRYTNTEKCYIHDLEAFKGPTALLQHLLPVCALHQITLSVTLTCFVSRASVDKFFSAFAALPSSLVSCDILQVSWGASEPPLGMQGYAPFLALPVRELMLEGAGVDLDLAEVRAFASAWPNLRRPSLGQDQPASPARVSLSALPDLVHTMPNLVELGIRVYDDDEALDEEHSPTSAPVPKLTKLDLGCSPLHNAMDAARYVVRNFPNASGC